MSRVDLGSNAIEKIISNVDMGDTILGSGVDVEAEYRRLLGNQYWRLNHLYTVVDKDGRKVSFKMNPIQENFYRNMWYWDIILKSRQHGFTTLIDLIGLDLALWTDDQRVCIIAQTVPDSEDIFDTKVMSVYNSLPKEIKDLRKTVKDNVRVLKFTNGSSVIVDTSARSKTINFLHISEFGKICLETPAQAKEIISGSFPTVHERNILIIESTAEGQSGSFYDFCKEGQARRDEGFIYDTAWWKNENLCAEITNGGYSFTPEDVEYFNDIEINNKVNIPDNRKNWYVKNKNKIANPLQMKYFFYAWHQNPNNVLDPSGVVIAPWLEKYFNKLKKEHGIELTRRQKAWYANEVPKYGDAIKQEAPSTEQECFEETVEGAYFTEEFRRMRESERITNVPAEPGCLVYTAWDLGIDDSMVIWFWQMVGREPHVIDYFESNDAGWEYYAQILKDKRDALGYRYANHIPPHDIKVRSMVGQPITRWQSALEAGIKFDEPYPAIPLAEGINATRNFLGIAWFDKIKCTEGLAKVELFRRGWDRQNGQWKNTPHKGPEVHAYDGMKLMALVYRSTGVGRRAEKVKPKRTVTRSMYY